MLTVKISKLFLEQFARLWALVGTANVCFDTRNESLREVTVTVQAFTYPVRGDEEREEEGGRDRILHRDDEKDEDKAREKSVHVKL